MKKTVFQFLGIIALLLPNTGYCFVRVPLYDSSQPFGAGVATVDIEPSDVVDLQPFVEDFGGAYGGLHHLRYAFGIHHGTRVTFKSGEEMNIGVPIEDLRNLLQGKIPGSKE